MRRRSHWWLMTAALLGCASAEPDEAASEAGPSEAGPSEGVAEVEMETVETSPSAPLADPLPGLAEMLEEQATRYPMMREEDLYKLITQAALGPSHIFFGSNSLLDIGLTREIATLPATPVEGEVTLETLDEARGLVRVNLRPFLKEGGRADDLARAIGWTSLEFRGDRAVLAASLAEAERLLPSLNLAIKPREFHALNERMSKRGYPPGRHSERYAITYEPAYRVVLRQYLTDRDFGGRLPQP